jgi:hypothetical protein
MTDLHSEQASYREKLLEHLFVGELLRHLWQINVTDVEILSPEVDNSGYDVVLECNGVLRYIQLKSSFIGSKTARQNLNLRLAEKPSGCVVWMYFDAETLTLGPFYWFGGEPGGQFPDISDLKVAKHSKGDASGTKNERANIRVLPKGRFEKLAGMAEVAARLFGVRREA